MLKLQWLQHGPNGPVLQQWVRESTAVGVVEHWQDVPLVDWSGTSCGWAVTTGGSGDAKQAKQQEQLERLRELTRGEMEANLAVRIQQQKERVALDSLQVQLDEQKFRLESQRAADAAGLMKRGKQLVDMVHRETRVADRVKQVERDRAQLLEDRAELATAVQDCNKERRRVDEMAAEAAKTAATLKRGRIAVVKDQLANEKRHAELDAKAGQLAMERTSVDAFREAVDSMAQTRKEQEVQTNELNRLAFVTKSRREVLERDTKTWRERRAALNAEKSAMEQQRRKLAEMKLDADNKVHNLRNERAQIDDAWAELRKAQANTPTVVDSAEKPRRIHYQDLVYNVANVLDGRLGPGTVVGTAEAPDNNVVERLREAIGI